MSEQDMAITEKEEEAETEISTNSNDPLVEEISTESVLEYEGLELLDQSPVLSPGVNEIWVRQVVEGIEVDRMAILHVPETLEEGESYPLVFAFHGNGGEAWTWVEELSDLVNTKNSLAYIRKVISTLGIWGLNSQKQMMYHLSPIYLLGSQSIQQ